ncbi:WecB/TagA/CpsF family glycosyltransferase [Clostridium estertheticum]|uniref:WecB/TagA/CpsF family glycosyltransferase n=1 Tax=Clostridium estertheticum TaxID=238834 RepID=UPI001C0BFE49|nr:WecB/TagA/CpsF family glycosyltransferase [Clostridium estertheticum]MBU3200970.1 WecB/TagA/CpsF family glycosyltransferase [Clostridium estertheticum]WAG63392.1 WecB/TagA/CpsF family glycosyltransferase [Clostridium estertheticum]
MKTCNILGVNINVTNMKDTVKIIESNLEELKGNYICISNVHTTVMSYENEEYKKIQNEGFMALPDGKPLSILSKIKGFKEARRVTGPDLMGEIFEIPKEKGYTHYFYGSTQETLDFLKVKLLNRYPKIQIAGMYSPPFRALSNKEDQTIVENINKTNADFLWVGIGAPKQEIWMSAHKDRVNSLMIGVGAGFDYHADKIKRAPRWMQQLSLEWVYRLLQDPKRLFSRYLNTNIKFIIYAFKVGMGGINK